MGSLIERAMGGPSPAWVLIKEAERNRAEVTAYRNGKQVTTMDGHARPLAELGKNPFSDVTSVEVFSKGPDRFEEPEMVELTIRIPEQFFTREYPVGDWEEAIAKRDLPGWGPEYLIDSWDIDVDRELYGPDGQQVPLW
jgi:hypothetical protein